MDLSRVLTSTLFRWLLIATFAGAAGVSGAADVDVELEFVPDAGTPNNKYFTNKTPLTGICAEYPDKCAAPHTGSSKVNVRFNSGPIYDFRENTVQFRIPSASRFSVKGVNGKQYPVTLHIRGVGARYDLRPATVLSLTGKNPPEGHKSLWVGGWFQDVNAPCRAVPGLDSGKSMGLYNFFWYGPEGAVCGKKTRYSLPGLYLDSMNFIYEVDTPNPYEMEAGIYEGLITYNVAREFEPGYFLTPYQTNISVKVTLRVTHVLRVNFYLGYKVELVPAGGWDRWESMGRTPTVLSGDAPFQLNVSSPFTVKLQCGVPHFSDCALKNSSGKIVRLDTFFTPPEGVIDDAGGSQYPFKYRLSALAPKKFNVSQYVAHFGKLYFQIPASRVPTMEAGTTYSGNVTVIWDSQV
ncbi:hypothetical protein [Pseudomonas sp. 65/3-MNA-CIBAN-0223]|uniref:hypothetical protein n=1 Tax=Pseudomonas sp. 65/3-MNA-CIBAN-0223 TaxID=3140476 RepID=UPI0033295256